MKQLSKYADWFFYASAVPVILATYGAFASSDIWLAPTQWLEVSILAIVFAVYLKHVD